MKSGKIFSQSNRLKLFQQILFLSYSWFFCLVFIYFVISESEVMIDFVYLGWNRSSELTNASFFIKLISLSQAPFQFLRYFQCLAVTFHSFAFLKHVFSLIIQKCCCSHYLHIKKRGEKLYTDKDLLYIITKRLSFKYSAVFYYRNHLVDQQRFMKVTSNSIHFVYWKIGD